MKKKLLSMFITVAMVAGCLAGCGSTDTASDTTTETSTTDEAKDDAATTESTDDAADASETTEVAATNYEAVQKLIAATTDTVTLRVWASEEEQEFTQGLIDSFKAKYADVNFDITLGKESESNAKDDILVDVEAGPDVYAFADDQINELVAAGALQEVAATYTFDVKGENTAGSIEAASKDGKLYAYPMTADNGYFMFYDASVFSEEDVQSMDTMIEKAKAAGKKIAMDVSNGWYIYSFFQGGGLELSLNDDGSNTCTWNAAGGTDVAQAILDLFATGVFVDLGDEDQATGITEGTICAAVNGTWRAETASDAWGDNYAAAKLPTFTVAGEQKQMSSYSGYKLIGVNPHSKFVGWSMLLAEYITCKDSQAARFEARKLGPSNIEAASSAEVQANPAIAALAAQAGFATLQRVGNNFWTPAETLGQILASGNPDGTDLQELLDACVEDIAAPVIAE